MSELSRIACKLINYVEKALADFKMIEKGDRVMVCLSGGKDSYTLVSILNLLRLSQDYDFEMLAFTLDQSQPGWDDSKLCATGCKERKISL